MSPTSPRGTIGLPPNVAGVFKKDDRFPGVIPFEDAAMGLANHVHVVGVGDDGRQLSTSASGRSPWRWRSESQSDTTASTAPLDDKTGTYMLSKIYKINSHLWRAYW